MTETFVGQHALTDTAARQLANATKTVPQLESITPRWLLHLLPWVPLEAGVYRVNRVKPGSKVVFEGARRDERVVPETFVDYDDKPREYFLSAVTTVLDIHTRVSDLYSTPHDQVSEQLRLTVEFVKERQERELIVNPEYGFLSNVAPSQRLRTRTGPPTPDDFDDLISIVWKEPAFFLAHPAAIAAFGKECTSRGVPPPTTNLFGSPFLTWRGLPIIPSDKLDVTVGSDGIGRTNILLLRVGEKRQGVVGLYQPGLEGEHSLGLAVRFMGISRQAIASYLISLYSSLAILTDDAVGLLEGVEVSYP